MQRPPKNLMTAAIWSLGCGGEISPGVPGSTETSSTGGSSSSGGDVDDPAEPTTTSTAGSTTGEILSTDGGESADSGSSSGTGPSMSCGNGSIDPGEQCDEGTELNDDHAYCTDSCLLNICGDGLLLKGWEICDYGSANSDLYGSECTTECTPGARCGDHHVDEFYEECDLGLDNGTSRGDDQGISCSAMCAMNALRVFVTSQGWDGDFGGLEGADDRCEELALVAGLDEPNRFEAFLSDGVVSVNVRFAEQIDETMPYVLISGKKVAGSYMELVTDGPGEVGITVTEQGLPLVNVSVATNTAPGGTVFSPDQHCAAWTSADANMGARVGWNYPLEAVNVPMWAAEQAWTGYSARPCDGEIHPLHLYCIEF